MKSSRNDFDELLNINKHLLISNNDLKKKLNNKKKYINKIFMISIFSNLFLFGYLIFGLDKLIIQ